MANLTFTQLWAKAVDDVLDLGLISSGVVDTCETNTDVSLLNPLSYNISVAHELDGTYDEEITEPVLVVEKPALSFYVLLTSGFFHRIRLEASADNQYYHVRVCEATMAYQGQLS